MILVLDLAWPVHLTDLLGGVEGSSRVTTSLLLLLLGGTHVVARGVCDNFAILLVHMHRVARRHHVACGVLAVAGGRRRGDSRDDAAWSRRPLLVVLMHVAIAVGSCSALGCDELILVVVLKKAELLVRAAQLLQLRLARAVVNGRDLLLAFQELLLLVLVAHTDVVHCLLLLC